MRRLFEWTWGGAREGGPASGGARGSDYLATPGHARGPRDPGHRVRVPPVAAVRGVAASDRRVDRSVAVRGVGNPRWPPGRLLRRADAGRRRTGGAAGAPRAGL